MRPRGFASFTVPWDDLVIRGGQDEPPEKIYLSMLDHYKDPFTPSVWGLSVALMTGADEPAILRAATHIRNRQYRVGVVESFRRIGFHVDLDSGPMSTHGVIWKQDEPTMDEIALLAAGFSEPRPNPYFEERRRRRASR